MSILKTTRYVIEFSYPNATRWFFHDTYPYLQSAKNDLFELRKLPSSRIGEIKYRLVKVQDSREVLG